MDMQENRSAGRRLRLDADALEVEEIATVEGGTGHLAEPVSPNVNCLSCCVNTSCDDTTVDPA
jgi:hypothetical protein